MSVFQIIEVSNMILLVLHLIGGKNYEEAIKYLTYKFKTKCKNPDKKLYVHVTCATDTENILKVWNAVKDIILRSTLSDIGM